jgi:lysophospholipase L1-like esterase
MKRTASWVIAAVALIAFAAAFSELQRMRQRFGEVTRHQFHDHRDVRQFMIRAALDGLDQPIVFLGDSITEMARLPESIAGHPVVNAGIGGALISDIDAPRLLDGSKPHLIVVALGANDIGSTSVETAYAALLSQLKQISPRLLAVAVTPMTRAQEVNAAIKAAAQREKVEFIEPAYPEGIVMEDGTHLKSAGYKIWLPSIVSRCLAVAG